MSANLIHVMFWHISKNNIHSFFHMALALCSILEFCPHRKWVIFVNYYKFFSLPLLMDLKISKKRPGLNKYILVRTKLTKSNIVCVGMSMGNIPSWHFISRSKFHRAFNLYLIYLLCSLDICYMMLPKSSKVSITIKMALLCYLG